MQTKTATKCPGVLIVGAFIVGIVVVIVPLVIVAGHAAGGGALTAAGIKLLAGAFGSSGGCS